jgi:hypothetical protein
MTEPSDADHVRQALHTLKLAGMAASLDAVCEQAAKEAWSYAQSSPQHPGSSSLLVMQGN